MINEEQLMEIIGRLQQDSQVTAENVARMQESWRAETQRLQEEIAAREAARVQGMQEAAGVHGLHGATSRMSNSLAKRMDVPKFTGKRDLGSEANTWIEKVKKFTFYTKVEDNEEGAILIASGFSDNADEWLVNQERAKGQNFSSITLLVEAVKENFVSKTSPLLIRDKLGKCKQLGAVTDYVSEFESLVSQLPPDMSDQDKMWRFCTGLNKTFRGRVESHIPETYARAVELALAADRVELRFEGTNGNRASFGEHDMDIDSITAMVRAEIAAITTETRGGSTRRFQLTARKRQLLEEKKCFICEKIGCRARTCPDRNKDGADNRFNSTNVGTNGDHRKPEQPRLVSNKTVVSTKKRTKITPKALSMDKGPAAKPDIYRKGIETAEMITNESKDVVSIGRELNSEPGSEQIKFTYAQAVINKEQPRYTKRLQLNPKNRKPSPTNIPSEEKATEKTIVKIAHVDEDKKLFTRTARVFPKEKHVRKRLPDNNSIAIIPEKRVCFESKNSFGILDSFTNDEDGDTEEVHTEDGADTTSISDSETNDDNANFSSLDMGCTWGSTDGYVVRPARPPPPTFQWGARTAVSDQNINQTYYSATCNSIYSSDWRLNPSVAKELFTAWGTPKVDLFASVKNKQAEFFCSEFELEKGTTGWLGADAFRYKWDGNDMLYLNPPWSRIKECVNKLIHDKTERAIVILPYYSRDLANISVCKPRLLNNSHNLFIPAELQEEEGEIGVGLTPWKSTWAYLIGKNGSIPKLANSIVTNGERFKFSMKVNKVPVDILVDSGCSAMIMSETFADNNKFKYTSGHEAKFIFANGTSISSNKMVTAVVEKDKYKCEMTFYVVKELSEAVILGLPWFEEIVITNQSWGTGNMEFKDNLSGLSHQWKRVKPQEAMVYTVSTGVREQIVRKLMDKYKNVFSKPDSLPPSRPEDHRIELVPGSLVPRGRPLQPMNLERLSEMKTMLDELLAKGFISTSISPYASSVIMVKKKDGSRRLCVDYRKLNDITIKNSTIPPNISECIDQLAGAQWFSKVDLRDGFYNVLIHKDDREKTAFRTKYGNFEFNVIPFGLTNAPAQFLVMMNRIFRDMIDEGIIVFVDDILIYTKTLEEHTRVLNEVFRRLEKEELYLKESKCELYLQEVEFLGITVSSRGSFVSNQRIKEISNIAIPKNVKEIQSLLGSFNFFRQFIPQFAEKSMALSELTKKQVPFIWGKEQQQAFEDLKSSLSSQPVLQFFDPTRQTVVFTDASVFGIGGWIGQEYEDGIHPITYWSRKLIPAERNYPTHERELLALVCMLKKFKHYLLGSKIIMNTDHRALIFLQEQPVLSARQSRWIETLQLFDIEISYLPGPDNTLADLLSRRPEFATKCGSCLQLLSEKDLATELAMMQWENLKEKNQENFLDKMSSDEMTKIVGGSDLSATTVLPATMVAVGEPGAAEEGEAEAEEGEIMDEEQMALLMSQALEETRGDRVKGDWLATVGSIHGRKQRSIQQGRNDLISGLKNIHEIYDANPEEVRRWSKQPEDFQKGIDGRWIFKKSRLAIPKAAKRLQHLIMYSIHDDHLSGHKGVRQSREFWKTNYYWENGWVDIQVYCSECSLCGQIKSKNVLPAGVGHAITPATDRFQSVAIDWAFVPSCRGFDKIAIYVCRFTKYVVLVPAKTTDTSEDEARRFFQYWVVPNGGIWPKNIVSDQDPKWRGAFMTTLTTLAGINLNLATSRHQSANGQAERMVRMVKDNLQFYHGLESKWFDELPAVAYSINSSISSATGETPYFAAFATRAERFFENLTGSDDANDFANTLLRTKARITENLIRAEAAMNHFLTKNRRGHIDASVGDFVMLSSDGLNLDGFKEMGKIFKPRYIGPFEVRQIDQKRRNFRLYLPPRLSRVYDWFAEEKLFDHPAPDIPTMAQARQLARDQLASSINLTTPVSNTIRSTAEQIIYDLEEANMSQTEEAVVVPVNKGSTPYKKKRRIISDDQVTVVEEVDELRATPSPPPVTRRSSRITSSPIATKTSSLPRSIRIKPIQVVTEEEDDIDPVYEIERLVAHRDVPTKKGSLRQYKVRWLNYTEQQDTWEPASELPEDLVTAYLTDLHTAINAEINVLTVELSASGGVTTVADTSTVESSRELEREEVIIMEAAVVPGGDTLVTALPAVAEQAMEYDMERDSTTDSTMVLGIQSILQYGSSSGSDSETDARTTSVTRETGDQGQEGQGGSSPYDQRQSGFDPKSITIKR